VADAAGKLGLINGGIPGALPVLGLVLAIKSGDPIGILGGLIGVFNPGLLTAGPLGWILAGASILKALTATTPKAWGVASVSYGPGFDNLAIQVNASGETFGTDKARQTEQILIDALEAQIKAVNQNIKDSLLAAGATGAGGAGGQYAIYSIAAYVHGTWTTGVNDAGNVNWTIQTIDNNNQNFELTQCAMGAQSNTALQLLSTTGRAHENHDPMLKDKNKDFRDAADSIAAYAIFCWVRGLNYSKNLSVNDASWRAVA
jgi:hypothetical protein